MGGSRICTGAIATPLVRLPRRPVPWNELRRWCHRASCLRVSVVAGHHRHGARRGISAGVTAVPQVLILRQSKFKRTTGKSRQLTLPSLSVRDEPCAPTGSASFTLKYLMPRRKPSAAAELRQRRALRGSNLHDNHPTSPPGAGTRLVRCLFHFVDIRPVESTVSSTTTSQTARTISRPQVEPRRMSLTNLIDALAARIVSDYLTTESAPSNDPSPARQNPAPLPAAVAAA